MARRKETDFWAGTEAYAISYAIASERYEKPAIKGNH